MLCRIVMTHQIGIRIQRFNLMWYNRNDIFNLFTIDANWTKHSEISWEISNGKKIVYSLVLTDIM